jgi:hypothetical protein
MTKEQSIKNQAKLKKSEEVKDIKFVLQHFDLPPISKTAIGKLDDSERGQLRGGLWVLLRLVNDSVCGSEVELFKLS